MPYCVNILGFITVRSLSQSLDYYYFVTAGGANSAKFWVSLLRLL